MEEDRGGTSRNSRIITSLHLPLHLQLPGESKFQSKPVEPKEEKEASKVPEPNAIKAEQVSDSRDRIFSGQVAKKKTHYKL